MISLISDERERFRDATCCRVCERLFEPEDVRDYCHLTGQYKGYLRYSYIFSQFIYDAHFIIKDVANAFPGSVELLPLTKKTYISFSKNVEEASSEERRFGRRVKLRFMDSFKFLSASLEKLASYLDKNQLKIARSEFPDFDDVNFELFTRKGVFPYEFVYREAFYSSLTGDIVSDSDYAHAIKIWERFRVETLGDYSDLYLKTDVLLLADVFENFRDMCMRSYGVDPAHYYKLDIRGILC
ncbi:hypothetical protein ACFW04_000796 [Cataglyphis niger]